MYAKEGGLFGGTHDFDERPKDLEMAWVVFRSWVDRR